MRSYTKPNLTYYIPNRQLMGVPIPLISKMLDYQFANQEYYDLEVFEKDKDAGFSNGGFYWHKTEEGYLFWSEKLSRPHYVKESMFLPYKKGQKIEVQIISYTETWETKIYLGFIAGAVFPFMAVSEKDYLRGYDMSIGLYKNIRPIIEEVPVELTLQDISNGKGKGVPVHLIRIKDK